jgi:hypothetical protein
MNDAYESAVLGISPYENQLILICGSERGPVSSLPVKPIAHAIARAEYENLRPPATQSRPETTVVPIGRAALSHYNPD